MAVEKQDQKGMRVMAIGVMLSGIFSGIGGVIWMMVAGHPILLALVLYPLAGLLGAAAFILLATLRHMLPAASAQPLDQLEPATQG